MGADANPGFRYDPRFCSLLRKRVWAIRTKQPDGTWRIVNCLDKDEACFGLNCAFTTDQGAWPYPPAPAEQPHPSVQ
jgi:hypothetical protein